MQEETSIQEVLKFVKEIKKLSQIDVDKIKDQEIVLIVGPTGSGKSTFLNMMAGREFTCVLNEECQWEMSAKDPVAKVGHSAVSQTFLPNYWEDKATKIFYCDCPGFHDTHGYVHDIAKSYFLKQIASFAKSLKVVALFEISVLKAEKGSRFGQAIDQIKGLIEKFNFETDCILVVTKCDRMFAPFNITKILQKKCGYTSFPEDKVFIIKNPDDAGNLTCLDNSIISKAKSLKQECHIPLSKENRLKIEKSISLIDKQIRLKTKKLEQLIELSAINFYQNNLKATQGEIEQYENLLDSSKQNFKRCSSIKELEDEIHDFCNHLVAKNCSSLSDLIKSYVKCIKQTNEGRIFLSDLLENESKIEAIKETFTFSGIVRKKRANSVGFESVESLATYLVSAGVEINNVKNSAHNKFTANAPSLTVAYDGVKDYSGEMNFSGQTSYKGVKEYSGTARYDFRKVISVRVNYTEPISASGSTSTINCSHNRGLFNVYCLLCSHHSKTISVSGVKQVSGTLTGNHDVNQTLTKDYNGVVNYNGKVPYKGLVKYNGVVPYLKSQDIPCKADHHRCSCSFLARLIFAAGRIMEDLSYFMQILQQQTKQMKKFSISSNSVKLKSQTCAFLKEVQKFSSSAQEQIKDQLHLALTQAKGTFDHQYKGQVPFNGSKSYSGSQKYSGNKGYNGSVNFSGSVPCRGTLSTRFDGSVSITARLQSCYDNCMFCNSKTRYFDKDVSINVSKNISRDYTEMAGYYENVPYSGIVKYDGIAPYSGEVNYSGIAKYQGKKSVTCDKDHHDCTSCTKWVEIVDLLKLMLEDKETLAAVIQKNSQTLQQACQQIFA